MSNIDKQALREVAELFYSEEGDHWWDEEQLTHEDGLGLNEADGKFIATANPATVLALLDELEAAEQRIAELQIARDKCFLSGLKTGWEYGIANEVEGYNREIADAQAVVGRAAAAGKGE